MSYQTTVRATSDFLLSLGVQNIPHSGRTLDKHLVGVWELMTAADYPESWRLAGLCHSLYAENGLLSFSDRDCLKAVIGEDAEELVNLFCKAKPDRLDWILTNAGGEKRTALVNLHVMSSLEQGQAPDWDRTRAYLSNRAFRVVRDALDENGILVFDDLCGDDDLIKAVWGELNQGKWKYGWKSHPSKPLHRFWNIKILGEKIKENTPEQFAVFKKEWPAVNRLMDTILEIVPFKYRVSRIYSNGYTYGTGGAPHRDDGTNTLLYYATPDWDPDWNGETLFFDENRDIEKALAYKPGRFAVFDSIQLHQGREVDKLCPALRTIITFKGSRL